jgi:hypothetical protein
MSAKTDDKAKVTKAQLREEIAQLRFIGNQMSSMMFNLAQSARHCQSDRELYDYIRRSWDAIKRSEPNR